MAENGLIRPPQVSGKTERRLIVVDGIVQGIGFRPFVYRLAQQYYLTGCISNTSAGVAIEVEGLRKNIDTFQNNLEPKAPPMAILTSVSSKPLRPIRDKSFHIKSSTSHGKVTTLISPDIAICKDCLHELFDPGDRRYHYPFINCTNCGPRYTIIENIPYDRQTTSMRHFRLCPACQAEYDDPSNRRFHAQPNACSECGPQVTLYTSGREKIVSEKQALSETISKLKRGFIVAIKGLGGFHLAVDAVNEQAVKELRLRKGREEKPLAVMVPDLKTANLICELSQDEIAALKTPGCPIVLAKKNANHGLAEAVAPQNDFFGVMLPYTPLHHLLFQSNLNALVMTSANYSEEPICIDNQEAFQRLNQIADYFLTHDRDIYLRSDDSIVIYLNGKTRTIRRSRGFAPRPILINNTGPSVLAVGAELKNTICLMKDNKAFLSQHIGDLENLEAYQFFQKTIDHLQQIFKIEPELVVHDLHPQYLSTGWAKEQLRLPTLAVQHHHAHLASCMAENHLEDPVIGLILDGTGYGTDNTIWGGEVLIGDYNGFKRYACFEPVPLPGGDAAIKAPWRTAVSYLHHSYNGELPDLPFLDRHDINPIIEMINKKINSPLTSSCGRLFDAVAALCGGKQEIRYEAQAAIEFMQQARNGNGKLLNFKIIDRNGHKEMLIPPIIQSVVDSIINNESVAQISAGFHQTLIELFTQVVSEASIETKIKDIVLSGGVFQNHLLFEGLIPALESKGLNIFTHSQIPANDGGLALGQALIGRFYLNQQ